MNNWLKEIRLVGQGVILEPLTEQHKEGLLQAAADGQLWNIRESSVPQASTLDAYLDTYFRARAAGTALAFAVIDRASGEVVGSTRFWEATEEHRRVEIGYTWYAQRMQRTSVNTECKLLLLEHAFEQWGCIRVEFLTHWLNHRSRRAIERLGANLDGILRNHRIMPDGSYRHTALYSILEADWPAVKGFLQGQLEKRGRE